MDRADALGLAGLGERRALRRGGRADAARSTEIRDAASRSLSSEVALLTYTVSARWAGEASARTWLASSVYVGRGGAWKLAFHQQTPVAPATG